MIDRALEIKPLFAHLVSNLTSLLNNWPNEEEWNILTILADLLAPFASVTRVISASSYPTIGEVKLLFEAYGDMSQNNIFEPIRRTMANYREFDDTHIPSQPIQASQRHLMNLSAIETRNFFRNLIAPNQTPQPVLNELELYFTSNSPGDEIVPL
ncbi:unnamed protein product [Rhizophagus irregularis]|nr:unnamed protein product [Rhizophagus irregularis]